MSAICTGSMLIPTLLWFREPPLPDSGKSLGRVLAEALLVLRDLRFMTMIAIYSGFWIIYFQQNGTVLWYLRDHVDMSAVNRLVNAALERSGFTTPSSSTAST